MSTKTITKRVALATVVALGAGVLSLVTVTSANATTQGNQAVGGGVTVSANGTNSTLGLQGTVGVTTQGTNSGGVATAPDIITATVLTTGALSFTAGTAGLIYGGYYTVSAGGYFTADTNTAANIGGGQTNDSATAVTGVSRVITVAFNGAAGSTVTINGYDTSAKGNLATTLIVTLAGSSVAGVPTVSKSNIDWSGVKGTSAITSDLSTGSATTTGQPLALQINLNDAYGSALSASNTGALTVTASSGANVSIGSGTGGSYSTAVATNGAPTWALITEATAGAGWSGSVTVSFNGVVLATKSGTISGLPAKIVATPLVIGHTNATIDSAVSYQAYDAAGNVTVIPVAQVALSSSDNTAAVTAIAPAGNGANSTNSSTSTGLLKVSAGTTDGTSNVVLKYTRPDGVVVSSNSFPFTVGGAAASYTATLDKSKYAPGDIATSTIKFLDSKGNLAASDSSLYTVSGTNYTWNATLTLPQLTQIGSAGAVGAAGSNVYQATGNVATDATGTIVLKWTVGTTEASYAGSIDFPTVDAVAGSAQAVSYSVSSGSTSLNDVLKGIVSLIASINKQIAALAKLVAPKAVAKKK
jgi:hypothetical protein